MDGRENEGKLYPDFVLILDRGVEESYDLCIALRENDRSIFEAQ